MGAEGFVGGFCNRGCNLGTTPAFKLVSFCVGTKIVEEVAAGLEEEADPPPPLERLRLWCPFAANNFAPSGTGGGGILFCEGLLDSADDNDDEEPRRLGESVVHERVDRSARLISPSSTAIESEASLLPSGLLEPEPEKLDAVPEPEPEAEAAPALARKRGGDICTSFSFSFTIPCPFRISKLSTLALALPLSNTTRPLFACPCWGIPSDEEFLPSLAFRARFLVVAAVATATAAFVVDVLTTRVEEVEEDATEPAVEFLRGCTAAFCSTCVFMHLITSNRCSGFVLLRRADEDGESGLVAIGLFDGRDLVSEGRGRDLGGREEGLDERGREEVEGLEEDEEEGLDDGPKDVDGPSFVLRREKPGIWSKEG